MDSSEARLDGIEAQESTDVSHDQQNRGYLTLTLIKRIINTRRPVTSLLLYLKDWVIQEYMPDFSQAEEEYMPDFLTNPRMSEFFAFPGVYVPMSPEIFTAVSAGKKECLEMIRSYGKPMVCLKSDQGDSVLHLAAAWGHLELVKSIVSACPCLLLELDWRNQLPLHVAARAGHVVVVKALVATLTFVLANLSEEERQSLDLYAMKDINGDNPLHVALKAHQKAIAFCLVKANQQASFLANNNRITPLYMAVEAGFVSLVEEMLKTTDNDGTDLQLEGRKCLVHAALNARKKGMLKIILNKYPSLEDERDEEGKTCLSFGASIGYSRGVRMLLGRSTRSVYICNDDGSFPIHIAIEKGHMSVVVAILRRCQEARYLLNKQGQNILHIASKSGKVSHFLFSYLRAFGSMSQLMEKQDVDGNTPLHLATINWHPRTLFYLLHIQKENCIYTRNNSGLSPLDIVKSNLQPNYIFMERMTLMVLLSFYTFSRDYQKMMTIRPNTPAGDKKKQYVNTLLVVAALVATVTFAAGFTIPGGLISSGKNLGSATRANDRKLISFIVFDIMAMQSSILTIATLIWAQLGDPAFVHRSLNVALPSLFFSLLCMPVAFYYGVLVAFAHVKGLVVFLNVTTVIFVVLMLIVLGPHILIQIPGFHSLVGLYFGVVAMLVSYAYPGGGSSEAEIVVTLFIRRIIAVTTRIIIRDSDDEEAPHSRSTVRV